jgi:hypothetical protein
MPYYVKYGALVGLPPIDALNAVVYGFFLQAGTGGELAAICKKVFEEPTKRRGTPVVKCRPLDQNHLMMTFASIPRVQSSLSEASVSENEVLLQIPVKITPPAGQPFNAFFAPYVCIDQPTSITVGREIYGYPKTFANVTLLPQFTPAVAAGLNLRLKAFGGNMTNPVLDLVPFIDVTPKQPNLLALQDVLAPLCADFQALVSNIFAHPLSPAGVRQVFLKQFQGADGISACSQQIVYADYTLKPTRPPAVLTEDYTVTVYDLDSHPARKELGIESPQTVNGGFVLTQNFVLGTPRVVWSDD